MYRGMCDHCGDAQVFGLRHLVGIDDEPRRPATLGWRCPGCRETSFAPTASVLGRGRRLDHADTDATPAPA